MFLLLFSLPSISLNLSNFYHRRNGQSWCNWEIDRISFSVLKGDDSSKRFEVQFLSVVHRRQNQCGGAVIQRRGISGSNSSVFFLQWTSHNYNIARTMACFETSQITWKTVESLPNLSKLTFLYSSSSLKRMSGFPLFCGTLTGTSSSLKALFCQAAALLL